jgi:hypothetical protein
MDESVPQALTGYRPQLLATLTGGLQQVRVLFPDNTIQNGDAVHLDHQADRVADPVQRLGGATSLSSLPEVKSLSE